MCLLSLRVEEQSAVIDGVMNQMQNVLIQSGNVNYKPNIINHSYDCPLNRIGILSFFFFLVVYLRMLSSFNRFWDAKVSISSEFG